MFCDEWFIDRAFKHRLQKQFSGIRLWKRRNGLWYGVRIQNGGRMKELDYTKIGMRIRQVRKAKGWSQDELAKKCGISMSFLGHIERGTRIMSLDTFANICIALGTHTDELLWGSVHVADQRFLDMWDHKFTSKEGKREDADDKEMDSYSIYVRIMKSVAEIMNESGV